MLVLTRKVNEEILIGGSIRIKIVGISAGRVQLGIEAPRQVNIVRGEAAESRDPDAERETIPFPQVFAREDVEPEAIPA